MSTETPPLVAADIPATAKIAVVAARFNASIVEELLAGCLRRLQALQLDKSRIVVHRVPGAFELPVAAKALAGRKAFSAIICLGAVVRGDTPHFEYVAGECARGLQQVAISEGVPVLFGVLTTNTHEQALERIGGKHGHAGERAADAAVEMIALLARINGIRS
jgi:6,7-dimethyl-8-ribityllumazine synthase